MDLINKNKHVMSDIVDINMIINTIYTIVQKTDDNLIFDKDKSYNKIKKYLEGNQINEENEFSDESTGFRKIKLIENSLIQNPNQIRRYNINLYIKIIEYLSLVLGPSLKKLIKSEENGYTDQIFFSVSRIINDVTPSCNYLGLTYRILDKDENQILKCKIAPYFNIYTQEYEIPFSFIVNDAKNIFCLKTFKESLSYLRSFISCMVLTTVKIRFYKILNIFFPEGFDKTRTFYKKDLETLTNWVEEVNKNSDADIIIDDKGIITARNKKFKLENIDNYIPPTSSYVFYC